MKTTITQVGDAPVILLDDRLLKQAGLQVGHQVNVEVCADGTITLAPINLELSVGPVKEGKPGLSQP